MTDKWEVKRQQLHRQLEENAQLVLSYYQAKIDAAEKRQDLARLADLSAQVTEDTARLNAPIARALFLLPPPPVVIAL